MPLSNVERMSNVQFKNSVFSKASIVAHGVLSAANLQQVVAEQLFVDYNFIHDLGWIVTPIESCHHSALLRLHSEEDISVSFHFQ